jgi:hypothetical protein
MKSLEIKESTNMGLLVRWDLHFTDNLQEKNTHWVAPVQRAAGENFQVKPNQVKYS